MRYKEKSSFQDFFSPFFSLIFEQSFLVTLPLTSNSKSFSSKKLLKRAYYENAKREKCRPIDYLPYLVCVKKSFWFLSPKVKGRYDVIQKHKRGEENDEGKTWSCFLITSLFPLFFYACNNNIRRYSFKRRKQLSH